MKITFVIPSTDFLASAGARIRYLRMVPLARGAGHEVQLVAMADWAALDDPGDVVIFSKCFDSRAIVAAAQSRAEGRAVGVDLFDDYFTQAADARMTFYRTWLDQMLRHAQFAICSTKRMADLVATRVPALPTHVFNDPASDRREESLPALLAAKRETALAERRIALSWFGIGDNPYFPVGLEDLSAFGSRFATLSAQGWRVELTVLTNARALAADRLAPVTRLPFPVTVELWSEERESQLLLDSLCCFLPVNAQPFSIAKSLNRAVSALTAGCQVVWAGYPLYSQLEPLIYADPETFLADLEADRLRHSPATFETYLDLIGRFAALETEVDHLVAFLETHCETRTVDPVAGVSQLGGPVPVLVHGMQTNGDAHKAARKAGMLSVGTPFSPRTLAYDVLFAGRVAGGELTMFVAETALARLRPALAAKMRPFGRINKLGYHVLPQSDGEIPAPYDWSGAPLADQLAAYAGIFETVETSLEAAFGPVTMMISENSRLPFDPAVRRSMPLPDKTP